MDYPGLSVCFLIILNFLVSLTTPQPNFTYKSCSTGGNYTTNSTYATNLKTLLSSISNSSDLNSDGFFNASIGQNSNQVYAIGLCRGDQTVTSCRGCLNDSSQAITQACPNQKGAIGGYDNCMIRFSNSNILSSVDDGFVYLSCNVNNATNLAQFNNVLGSLLFSLRDRAAAAATRKYAADEANYTSFSKIYGLEQCTPDISEADCGRCLDMARIDMTNSCSGKVGATSVRYSCVLRFELYQFYQPTAGAPPPPPPRGTESPPPSSTDTPGTQHVGRVVAEIFKFGISFKFHRRRWQQQIPDHYCCGYSNSLCRVDSVSNLPLSKMEEAKTIYVHACSRTRTCPISAKELDAWKYWREGAGSNLIDPALRVDSSPIRDIIRCIHIGLLCVQENVASRPVMASVVLMLSSFSITLPQPSEPAFFMDSSIDTELPLLHEFSSGVKDSSQSTSKSAYFSENEASISELHPR
ncbi:hypothetical protein RJ639_045061 [Escallonia herrerae]|uniref:Gnk2-homologous domain-containing protein n=1 Tax=Escallonia herrerae TaxID=1293975 RepID=A0AA88WEV9_9ASTE|nr:hypothetical protein RJ639_045061 [Escallonia herrerae]